MKLISHRGNLEGPNRQLENSVAYIRSALKQGYDVEIDVWQVENSFFLGHDYPQYKLQDEDLELLTFSSVWCHAKNLSSFLSLLEMKSQCFWHQNDDFALTSTSFIWTYPKKELTRISICVTNEMEIDRDEYTALKEKCYGICSDYVKVLKNF